MTGPSQGPGLTHILVSADRPPQVTLTCVSLSICSQLGPRQTAPDRKIHLALGALNKRPGVTKRGTLGPTPPPRLSLGTAACQLQPPLCQRGDLQQVTFCASISPSVNWAARAPRWVTLETEGACVGRGLPPEHEHPLPPRDKPPPAARALGWRTCSPARGARPVATETEAWEQHQPPDARSRWLGASCAPCGPRGAKQGWESPRGPSFPGANAPRKAEATQSLHPGFGWPLRSSPGERRGPGGPGPSVHRRSKDAARLGHEGRLPRCPPPASSLPPSRQAPCPAGARHPG